MADDSSSSWYKRRKIPKAKPRSKIDLPKCIDSVAPCHNTDLSSSAETRLLNCHDDEPFGPISSFPSPREQTSEGMRMPIGRSRALEQKIACLPFNVHTDNSFKPVGVTDDCRDAPSAVPGECNVNKSWETLINAPVGYQMSRVLGDRFSNLAIHKRRDHEQKLGINLEGTSSENDSDSSNVIFKHYKSDRITNSTSGESLEVTPINSEVASTESDDDYSSNQSSNTEFNWSGQDAQSSSPSLASPSSFSSVSSNRKRMSSSDCQSSLAVGTSHKGSENIKSNPRKKSLFKKLLRFKRFEDELGFHKTSRNPAIPSMNKDRERIEITRWTPMLEDETLSHDILSKVQFPDLQPKGNIQR